MAVRTNAAYRAMAFHTKPSKTHLDRASLGLLLHGRLLDDL